VFVSDENSGDTMETGGKKYTVRFDWLTRMILRKCRRSIMHYSFDAVPVVSGILLHKKAPRYILKMTADKACLAFTQQEVSRRFVPNKRTSSD